jgi:hypothetical protein
MQHFVQKKDKALSSEDDTFIRVDPKKVNREQKIQKYKEKVASEEYMDSAIQKIARDLTYFLTK